MEATKNAEVMIASGLHQFQHGRIASVDYSTTIPFAHVILRGRRGQFLSLSGAYVPLKYCAVIDKGVADACHAAAKAARKVRRAASKALAAAAPKAKVDVTPIDWAS